ncbi:MAG: hypothetical protein CVU98_10325 [Firmicutes bacterium HGW-Firmicutes-3]|jgi:hypothetical protein|nr:MAG: hypothetical protein CVU98_10325 [Firmicutes bacterium HGW-Firmicutes-3]
MLFKYEVGEEVISIYNEIVECIGVEAIRIVHNRAPFSRGTASYVDNGDGTFLIYYDLEKASDFIMSHELLHIYSKVFNIIPSISGFSKNYTDTALEIAIMLTDFASHKWIFAEQRRRGIVGVDGYIDTQLDYIMNLEKDESGVAMNDFLFIRCFYIFLNDFPEYQEQVLPHAKERFPNSYIVLDKLLSIYLEDEVESPFVLRRKFNKVISIWKDIFREYIHLNLEILLVPVVRRQQLDRAASSTLEFHKVLNGFCCTTKNDGQRCSSYFRKEEFIDMDYDIKTLSLNSFFQKYKMKYYIDDRNGTWSEAGVRN